MKKKYIYKLSRVREVASRESHKLQVVGSIPSPATRYRSVAQPGSAPGLGPGGRRFESYYSDQFYYKGNIMSCRGYDPKTVKINKTVKRAASLIADAHKRGAFIRSFVAIEQSNSRSFGNKGDKK